MKQMRFLIAAASLTGKEGEEVAEKGIRDNHRPWRIS